jgi:hypothetical protein
MNRRWLALIAVALAPLLIAPVVLLLVARPVAAPSAGPSDLPSTPSGSPSPAAPADGAIAFVDAESPEEAAWYRIGADPRQFPPRLQIGTMAEGATFEREMADPTVNPNAIVPLRPVLGVGDGVVVIVEDDRRLSIMRAVVAATGEVHDLLASDDVIVNGLLDRDGRVAYYLTADRVTGDFTGAWRLAVVDGNRPEPIEELLAAAPEFRLAAVTRLFSRMLLSPDGATLGLFQCVELDCALRAVRTDDGSLVGDARIPRGGGDPFAITNTTALLSPIVPDGPFRFGEVVDLASGANAPMPFEGWPFGSPTLIEGADGPAMVVQTAGFSGPPEAGPPAEPPKVAIIGAADMLVVAEHAPPLASLAILDADDSSIGVDLPPGWILMWGTEPGEDTESVYALNAADGSLVRLPGVGGLFVQG